MMPGGRPPKGAGLVDGLEGSEHAKRRLATILRTVRAEQLTVEEACEQLSVSPSAFHELRKRALENALQSLEPRRAGRPARVVSEAEREIEALRKELSNTRHELRGVRVREEFIAASPSLAGHLLGKKSGRPRREGRGADDALPARGDVPPGKATRPAPEGHHGEASGEDPSM